jgi:hypothetical protein
MVKISGVGKNPHANAKPVYCTSPIQASTLHFMPGAEATLHLQATSVLMNTGNL